ncbi:MAG: type VII secretion target [Mycobacterium sp.]
MADHIHLVPEELRQAAREHLETAERLGAAPSANTAVMATLESLGPVFAELREAGRELLDQRRACYEQQSAAHAEMAERLDRAAGTFERHEAESADRLRAVAEGDS